MFDFNIPSPSLNLHTYAYTSRARKETLTNFEKQKIMFQPSSAFGFIHSSVKIRRTIRVDLLCEDLIGRR